jgi:hypothetical protein
MDHLHSLIRAKPIACLDLFRLFDLSKASRTLKFRANPVADSHLHMKRRSLGRVDVIHG